MKDFLNQVEPVLVTCLVGVIIALVKTMGDVAIAFLISKKDVVLQVIEENIKKKNFQTALEVWGIVDEHFRLKQVIESTIESKQKMFGELLLKKIPGLTEDEVSYIRQAIAGEVNKFKADIKTDDRVRQLQEQLQQQIQQNQALQSQTYQLKQALSQVQNTIGNIPQ